MRPHHHVIGHGPPLLILHGLLGSLDNWMPHAQALSVQFQVFLLDLRNHGRSPHTDDFTYELMATDIAGFIQDHHLGPVSLIGHSMGGKVAMRLAQLHPRLLHKLIVVDMSPREYPPRYAEILATMHALDLTLFHQRSEVEAALLPAVPDKNIRQFLLKNLGRDETGKLRWKPNVAALRANYHHIRSTIPRSPQFCGPTLFIRGGQSDYLTEPDVTLIQQIFPQATVETIAPAGHWVHAETPEVFLRLVTQFLAAER
ncbi:MAG: alpha/beta fold hydrolase [Verrucomicrobiota bacterium]